MPGIKRQFFFPSSCEVHSLNKERGVNWLPVSFVDVLTLNHPLKVSVSINADAATDMLTVGHEQHRYLLPEDDNDPKNNNLRSRERNNRITCRLLKAQNTEKIQFFNTLASFYEESLEVSLTLKKKHHSKLLYFFFLTHGSSSPPTLFIESYLLAC